VPVSALISPLGEGSFALKFSREATGSGRFFAGPENALLLRAVDDFCAGPACPYNPLVLYGPAGIGKTLLARGIAARVGATQPGGCIVYLTGADFTAEYARAIETRSVMAWRHATRSATLLVLDDVGPLAAKRPAQIELMRTMEAVVGDGGQVLVTAPQAPGALSEFLPALSGRLAAGLAVGIALPGAGARRAVVWQLAAERKAPIAAEAIELLADELPVVVPELSGALHELFARCTSTSTQSIDRAQVRSYLSKRRAIARLTVREIATCAARQHGLRVADLRGPSRRQTIVTARALAMYAARQWTGKSLGSVGKYFGGRDHSTVLHACRKTETSMATDPCVRQSVTDLRAMLQNG